MAARRVRRIFKVTGAPRQWIRRRLASHRFMARCPAHLKQMGDDLRTQGYAKFQVEDLPQGREVLSECSALREQREPSLKWKQQERPGKFSIALDLATDFELQRRESLLRFALQMETCAPAIASLGTVPYLARVALALSLPPSTPMELVHFQRFHLDNDDLNHVKLYINVHEVCPNQGPLTFLPKTATARVLKALRKGRTGEDYWTFDDEEVFQHASRDELVSLAGPAGTGVYIDASQCLHFGSRVADGHERLVFGAVYIPYHRIKKNVTNQLDPAMAQNDWQRLLLDPPSPQPMGTFFPDWEGKARS